MFRLIRVIAFLVLLILVIFVANLWVSRVEIVEKFLSKNLDQTVTVGAVKVGFNYLELNNFRIESQKESRLDVTCEIKKLSLYMSLLELFKESKTIEVALIEEPIIHLELYNASGNRNNWAQLINQLPKKVEGPFYTINELSISDIQFHIIRANEKRISTAPIPILTFYQLGSKRPLTISQVGRVTAEAILRSLTNKIYLTEILREAVPPAQNLMEGAHSLFPVKSTPSLYRNSLDAIRKHTQKTNRYIQDFLFKKKPS